MPSISQTLEVRLNAAGDQPLFLGELVLLPAGTNPIRELRHLIDAHAAPETLTLLADLPSLREITKTDAAGAYRPLRVAQGLRRSWRSGPLDLPALIEALHAIYPSALSFWAVPATPVPFAETAQRQTGMYRIIQTCGENGAPLLAAVAKACDTVCLRRRLWGPSASTREEIAAESAPDALPLLCPEACNYLVAQVREEIVAARDRDEEA